jgi:putative ABC transport system ATP-binding protein
MKETILSAKDLCKSFASNGDQNHVLSNVNVEIYEKDFTVVMGASGSGKSTLLYCLSGMDKITAGKIFYQGNCISEYKENELAHLRRGEFGFVFQQMHLVSNLTIFENVAVPGYLNKSKKTAQVNERTEFLLELMSLSKVAKHLPSQVSGGEQQRAAIARAMISEPKLLFADEPTGALNRKNSTIVLDLLTKLNQEGQSILMVTHDIHAALRADRLLYIEDGKINGELKLSPFVAEEAKSREIQINAWLTSMSW